MNKQVKKPNVVRGGIAIPLGRNYYYMAGRKHKNGGIDVGKNPRTGLEVEDGEVMHISDKNVKVFSSVPFLNGKSPAQKVLGGENPNEVFKQQELFKDRNGINDDGTKKNIRTKAKMGTIDWDKVDEYADTAEKTLGAANLGLSAATIAAPNPYTAAGAYVTGIAGTGVDLYQGIRSGIKGDWAGVGKNAADIGISLIGLRALKAAKKWDDLNKAKQAAGVQREYVRRSVGKGTKHRYKIKRPKEAVAAENNYIVGYGSIPISTFFNFVDPTKLNNKDNTNNKKAMGGENPDTVFREQENFKDRNRINDNGARKKQYGGDDKPKFNDWYKTVPKEINDTTNYNLRRAYELLPYAELENWRNGKGKIHLRSVAPTENGNYEFLKSKNHPTYKKEIEWYNSPDGESFRKEYVLDESTEYPTYKKRNKKAMGGLSRSKDYGSKLKPYPKVKSKDFAGKGRSYPIPTKEDAIDALRLAGLHGRNDVKSKVYRKYPVLRKKAKWGLSKNDTISLAANVGGSLISAGINAAILSKLKSPNQPISAPAAKLKTKININPQLDKMRETIAEYERNVDNNTLSSRVALARKQNARLAGILQTNELYGEKENKETELINADKLNQQAVTAENIKAYNDWNDRVTAFENDVLDKHSENIVNSLGTINQGVQDTISRIEQRDSERQTRLAMLAAYPNVNPRILRTIGVKGITDADVANWEKLFYNKKNKQLSDRLNETLNKKFTFTPATDIKTFESFSR